jgi:hypothetical protein
MRHFPLVVPRLRLIGADHAPARGDHALIEVRADAGAA